MRYGLTLSAVLMGSSLLAGTTLGADSGHHQRDGFGASCKVLERRLERCERKTHESCDRAEQAWRALCGPLESILASSSADGVALELLRQDYEIVPIEEAPPDVLPRHVVIAPDDLDDPITMLLVRAAYRHGKSVAIVGANQAELDRFQQAVVQRPTANCTPEGPPRVALYGVQKAVVTDPSQSSSFCLLSASERSAAINRRWLRERFAVIPPLPPAGEVAVAASETLEQLAAGSHCSFVLDSPLGRTGWNLNIYSMRAFTDTGCQTCQEPGADYYLVQDAATFTPSRNNGSFKASVRTPTEASSGQLLGEDLRILATGPSTVTSFQSSYTNGNSATVSGSVGWSQDNGFNVSVGGSVTTSSEKTYTVPPTKIEQSVDTVAAAATWTFAPQSIGANASFGPATTTWVWFVPKDAYPSGGTFPPGGKPSQIRFSSGANIFYSNDNTSNFQPCSVDYPFPLWTVPEPQITRLDPDVVTANGGGFTIKGANFYDDSITAVTIGGTAINLATNYTWQSLEKLLITVDGSKFGPGTYQVRVNTQFNGTNRQSNPATLTLVD
jgi:hypothetical protein